MRTDKDLLERIDALKDELDKKGRIVSSIYKISQLLNRPANRDKILRAILYECQKLFSFSRSVILLINKNDYKLEAKYCLGYSPLEEKRAYEHPLDMETQLCRETIAAREGRIIYIQDIENDTSLTEFDRKMEKFWKRVSTIAVPLKINQEVIGVIEGDRKEKMILSKSDIKLLTSFANQASVILEIAHLYNQILTERNIAENILESAPDGILAIDKYKKINSINRKAGKIIRKKRQEVLGKPISEVLRRDIVDLLNDSIDNQKPSQYMEIVNKRRSGKTETYGMSSSIMKKSLPHEDVGAILTIRDLTELKQTEEMLRRVDNLSSLGRMSASIAHEIRNPLASINFNVQVLSKKIVYNEDMQRISNNILEGIERINMIIKRTLDFSKNLSPSMTYGHINDIIRESIALIHQQLKSQKIVIKEDLLEGAPRLLFDPHQLRNAIVNILLNAAEATPKGGTITIRSRIAEHSVPKQLILFVKDNGIGIPQDNIKRIFDPFFTTKQEGTGLGLSIAHKILEQHNVLIDVRSRENKGTTFYMRFPLNEDAVEHAIS
ncbi:MAG: ATP-binding protein [Syntrophales bacterium]|nr:ATP-binding protein [Syntrophales bacterium]